MATLKPLYGSKTSISITLNNLANGSTATSSAIDNSSNLYQDAIIEVTIAGTAATDAYCDVRLLVSEDNSTFSTWESAVKLGAVYLSSSPNTGHFSILDHLSSMPKYWKIAVKNNTGNALSSSGNSASYQGVNIQSV